MKYILASNNPKKLVELSAILAGANIITLSEAGITDVPDETGESFEENAVIKAHAAMQVSGMPAIADDSGLVVDALGGAPGVHSARFCEGSDSDRTEFLLRNMHSVPDCERTARFVSAVACVFPDGRQLVAVGKCEGVILRAPRGDGGFGYDPVFYVPQHDMTYAEMPFDLKNSISHRGQALVKLKEMLEAMPDTER